MKYLFVVFAPLVFITLPQLAAVSVAAEFEERRYAVEEFIYDISARRGPFIVHRITDGPCSPNPKAFAERALSLGLYPEQPFIGAGAEVIIPLLATSDDYAEGWHLQPTGGVACLRWMTLRVGLDG